MYLKLPKLKMVTLVFDVCLQASLSTTMTERVLGEAVLQGCKLPSLTTWQYWKG